MNMFCQLDTGFHYHAPQVPPIITHIGFNESISNEEPANPENRSILMRLIKGEIEIPDAISQINKIMSNLSEIQPRFLRAADAAKYLGISRAQIYILMKDGKIKSNRIGGLRLFDRLELDRFGNGLPVD